MYISHVTYEWCFSSPKKTVSLMFHPMFYILQKYFSQFLVVFNITSEDEGTL